jgi:DNA-binding NarL/FixJ family response regulator
MQIKIGIVDDHLLFLESLVSLLEGSDKFSVVIKALNGKELQAKLKGKKTPDIMLIDVNMPDMDGFETTAWLKEKYPGIKLVALSMKDDERTIIRMLKAGCCSYLLKDISPVELENALEAIDARGYYNGDTTSSINITKMLLQGRRTEPLEVTDKELSFLKFVCSDMTYKEIAQKMDVTERAVNSMRDLLFLKFKVQSRVGLCLEAIRNELIKL